MVSFFIKTLLATIFFVFTASHPVAEKAFDSSLSSALENKKNEELSSFISANNLFGVEKKKPAPKKPAAKKTTKKGKVTTKGKATTKKAATTGAATTEAVTTEAATTAAPSK
uniref:Secreted protein n=1 Tax=Strongyloides papillosus TaxID=174720 RepID=A0A0N5BJ81_STREA